MDKRTGLAARLIASGLCAAILLLSPGPAAYAGAAQMASVKVLAPVNASMGMAGGVLNNTFAGSVGLRSNLPAMSLTGSLTQIQAAPAVADQALSVSRSLPLTAAAAPEASVAAVETVGTPVSATLPAAAPAEGAQSASPTGQESVILQQAQAFGAQGSGRMAAPAKRVRAGILKTLRLIFDSKGDDEIYRDLSSPSSALAGPSAPAAVLQKAAQTAEETAAPEPVAPAPAQSTASSKIKTVLRWALPILAGTALIFGLDFGTKLLATKFLFTVFHECAWRAPFLAGIIPYIAATAFIARRSLPNDRKMWRWSAKELGNGRLGFYRVEVSGLETMAKEHPSLRWALRLYDISIALMLGGMLGNGIDAFRLGGALDWIPLGRSMLNFADVALLSGLAFFQLATNFFIKAGKAHREGQPLHMSTVGFLGLPLVGFFIAWAFGSAATEVPLNLAMKSIAFIYIMGFSMLLGISRFLAAMALGPFIKRFVAGQGQKKA